MSDIIIAIHCLSYFLCQIEDFLGARDVLLVSDSTQWVPESNNFYVFLSILIVHGMLFCNKFIIIIL